jgi:hypothetical protein
MSKEHLQNGQNINHFVFGAAKVILLLTSATPDEKIFYLFFRFPI